MTDSTHTPNESPNASGKKIGIFVIAFNAESHLENTLDRIPQDLWPQLDRVYIIDDCSTDDTVHLALRLKDKFDKLEVIRNKVNRRYGGNQKNGYQYAIDHDLDIVALLHADGQYAPEHLPNILQPLIDDQAEVVLGSRMINRQDALKGGMPKYKYYGNIFLTKLQNMLCGTDLAEFHTGYRAYATKFLKSVPFWENTDEWHFDTEILLQAKASEARILELPIPTYYGDEICHVNGIAYAMNCISTALRFALFRSGIIYNRIFDVNIKGRKYFSKFDDPYSSHSLIYKFLETKNIKELSILELGVGDASLTERLHQDDAKVDCIELDPESAQLAEPFAQKVSTANVEQLFPSHIEKGYDMVIAADILEHLVDPESVLSGLKAWTVKDGELIVSLPNVVNIYVRLSILLGRFRYHRKGILDATHLHFYTSKSARRLLEKTGWVVDRHEVTAIPAGIIFPFLRKTPFRFLHTALYGCTRLFKGLLGYQLLFYCRNPNQSELL